MSRGTFTTVKTQGGLLPPEVLERIAAGDSTLPGADRATYHLAEHERLGEAINRSWNRLLGLWTAFRDALEQRPASDLAVGLTRDRWLLPLFDELGYGRLIRSAAVEIEGKSFAISHAWYRTPIHLVGARVSIDRRMPGVAGAAAAAPHSLLQEFLNRSDEHLWGVVSNGRLLRILRDNHSLSRQAFVEFDLEAIMEGELFSDFRLLWLVCHQSRVEAEEPSECWLEVWFQQSREEGIRALDRLRKGVEDAIEALGAGFLRHTDNRRLREALGSGELNTQEYYRELLRLVYRLIFLFVAEDRDALLDPEAPAEAKRRFTLFYATRRLRELAARRRGTHHADHWRGMRLVMSKLHGGCPELALPALGSFLWSEDAAPWTRDAELHNEDLLRVLRALCYITDGRLRYPVNWRTIGAEELGSVYESLLELHPHLNREAGTFELTTAAGHERKTTGSYYTPTSLVEALLDSALEPVLQEAMLADDREAALMKLKVCDPAVGSGHFLLAAARRMALRLASVRTGDEEASPEAVTEALRYVVGHCLYGVDLNPMAAELCKVSLWMEALEPGKPLSFLEHRIQVGNSLLGATPALLGAGIPDDAFKPIEGDDPAVCREFKKQNKQERESQQLDAYSDMMPWERLGDVTANVVALDALPDVTVGDVQRKEELYAELVRSASYEHGRLWADAWCAAFVWKKTKEFAYPITEEVFRRIERNPHHLTVWMKDEIIRLREQYQFFHWHLAFPDVFCVPATPEIKRHDPTGWEGGFDVVLGNPPYVRPHHIRPAIKQFLWGLYSTFVKKADLYCAFVELGIRLLREDTRLGFVLSSGWLRLDSFENLRKLLLEQTAIHTIVEFTGKVFEDASVAVSMLALRKARVGRQAIRVATLQDASMLSAAEYRKLDQDSFRSTYKSIFDLSLDSRTEHLKDKLRQVGKPLGEMFDIAFGLKTGDDTRFLTYDPDTSQHKRLLRGENVHRYQISFAGEYVWYVPELMVTHRKTARPGTADRFEQPKVLVRDTGGGLQAAYDGACYYVKDVLVVTDPEENPRRLLYLTALLNSKLLRFFYDTSFPTLHVQRGELASLPIPPFDDEEIHELVATYAEELTSLYVHLAQAVDSNTQVELREKIMEIDEALDDAVFRLIRLTPDEIGVVQEHHVLEE
jgi:hypothetical protein